MNLLRFTFWILSHGQIYTVIWTSLETTRTTRMPVFWGYPPPPHDYPYYWSVNIGSPIKTTQSQSYKFKEFAKTSYILILINFLHATHVLKLLDKMCKYEMDPASIVEDTERMDRRTWWNQYTTLQLRIMTNIECSYQHKINFPQIPPNRHLTAYLWERKLFGIFCAFKVWLMFNFSHCNVVCNMMVF